MRVLENQTLTIKDHNGKTKNEHGTFIPVNDFGMHTHAKALEYSLLILEAIEKANRLNMFLQATSKDYSDQVNTEIFYRLLAWILESGKDFTKDDQKQYFEVVKQLYKHSQPFYFVHDDLFFTPKYELDMFVLGVVRNDYTDQYADLNYSFMNDEITYTEFVQKFKEQHPAQ